MTALDFSSVGQRTYETGVDRGVLYVGNSPGVIWPGLISISENPTGSDAVGAYLDGVKYLNRRSPSEFEGTIKAFSSPREFDTCVGIARVAGLLLFDQPKKLFGLSYRTKIGNDLVGDNYGYKIHLIYNASAGDSSKEYATVADSVNVTALSWPITAKPISVPGFKPNAHFVVDSLETDAEVLFELEAIIYGSFSHEPRLPTADEFLTLFGSVVDPTGDPSVIYDGGNSEGALVLPTEPVIFDGGTSTGSLDFIDAGEG